MLRVSIDHFFSPSTDYIVKNTKNEVFICVCIATYNLEIYMITVTSVLCVYWTAYVTHPLEN